MAFMSIAPRLFLQMVAATASAETEWYSVVLSCRLVVVQVPHGFGGGLAVGLVLVLGLLLVAH